MTSQPRPPAEPPRLAPPAPQCPDCRDGNCQKCNTQAWDFEEDKPTFCACWAENRTGQHND